MPEGEIQAPNAIPRRIPCGEARGAGERRAGSAAASSARMDGRTRCEPIIPGRGRQRLPLPFGRSRRIGRHLHLILPCRGGQTLIAARIRIRTVLTRRIRNRIFQRRHLRSRRKRPRFRLHRLRLRTRNRRLRRSRRSRKDRSGRTRTREDRSRRTRSRRRGRPEDHRRKNQARGIIIENRRAFLIDHRRNRRLNHGLVHNHRSVCSVLGRLNDHG